MIEDNALNRDIDLKLRNLLNLIKSDILDLKNKKLSLDKFSTKFFENTEKIQAFVYLYNYKCKNLFYELNEASITFDVIDSDGSLIDKLGSCRDKKKHKLLLNKNLRKVLDILYDIDYSCFLKIAK